MNGSTHLRYETMSVAQSFSRASMISNRSTTFCAATGVVMKSPTISSGNRLKLVHELVVAAATRHAGAVQVLARADEPGVADPYQLTADRAAERLAEKRLVPAGLGDYDHELAVLHHSHPAYRAMWSLSSVRSGR